MDNHWEVKVPGRLDVMIQEKPVVVSGEVKANGDSFDWVFYVSDLGWGSSDGRYTKRGNAPTVGAAVEQVEQAWRKHKPGIDFLKEQHSEVEQWAGARFPASEA